MSDFFMPPVEIKAPPLRRRPNGLLLDVAHQLTASDLYNPDATMDRVVGGITFCPQGCAGLEPAANVWCETDLEVPDAGPSTDDAPSFGSFAVFGREDAPDRFERELAEGRIVNRFDTQISAQLARELLTGASSGNPALQDSVTAEVLAPVAPDEAVYAITELLASVDNAQGTIFAAPALFDLLASELDVTGQGGVYMTAAGHYVVGDSGFDGSGPDGNKVDGESWVYATLGVPYVWLGERQRLGDDGANFDRTNNNRSTVYVQEALVAFEPCFVGAVPVDVPSTDIGS